MKYKLLLPFLAVAFAAQAQDTYTNERITNNSSDVIGTARYVGMGGALGALGADISVISWNPAGIGLYRKNDIALTFGGTWGKSHIAEEHRGKATFDQIGFVYNMKTGGETCPYVNFAFNFQKKINFNHNFYADNPNLRELSQLDQLAELTEFDEGWQENLTGMALEDGYFSTSPGNEYHYNKYGSSSRNVYTHHSEGSLQAFDFNLSTNINNRAFLGLTVGVDAMRYRGWSLYGEDDMDGYAKYDVNNDYRITGTGVNVKLGAIVRPFENSPFRIGFAVETPTWYRLKNDTWFDMVRGPHYGGSRTDQWNSYLKFNLRSPWKVRTSIGSTVGSSFAWDVDYEFAAYAGTSMGYPEYEDDWDGSTSGNIKDVAMNELTRDNLRGTHTLRVGMEANATKNLAFRLGYNHSTSAYEKNISYDQYYLNSAAMDYATGTSYMRMGAANILTLGVGYRAKNFYVDLAYKIRNQKADFYAFDTSFANSNQDPIPQFVLDNPLLADVTLDPVNVNLTRQAVTCTLGFKF
jgi:hypothetical protein